MAGARGLAHGRLPRRTRGVIAGLVAVALAACSGARTPQQGAGTSPGGVTVDPGAHPVDPTPSPAQGDASVEGSMSTAAPVAVEQQSGGPPVVCTSRHLGEPSTHHLLACPVDVVQGTAQWEPDVLVTLGGGILGPGHPGCATVQRAYATHQLFEALGQRPWLLLSGHGPVEPARPVDPVEATCAAARLDQELAAHGLPLPVRAVVDRERATLTQAGTAELTEADYMCASVLAWYPAAARPAVLARMVFEPRSMSTLENASYAMALVAQRGFRRAEIVSTPVVRPNGSVDNHPQRALEDFRSDRTRGVHAARLAAVGCPFDHGGPAWEAFESGR